MNVNIELNKLSSVLEYFLSIHEADTVSYMLTDENITKDDILNYLKQISD